MDELYPNSERFWAFMLPITTALTIIGTAVAEHAANAGELLQQSNMMQSGLIMSLCMGLMSIIGFRAVIARAIEDRSRGVISVISASTIIFCSAYIAYGISSY